MDLVILAAVAENGVIGSDGEMPWHHSADLQHFKETTLGHPVIMGRVTYESIHERLGEPLPDRTSIVLSRRGVDALETHYPSVLVVDSIDDAITAAESTDSDVAYVVGGASIYEQFLPRVNRMVLTEIPEAPPGDTYFPDVDWDGWTEVKRDERGDLAFVTYERRDSR